MKILTGCVLCALTLFYARWAARAQESAPNPFPALADTSVIATVNSQPITMEEWLRRLQTLRAQDFVASTNPLLFKSASGGQIALISLINTRLLLQYAAKTSLLPGNAEVDAEVEAAKKQPAIQQNLQRKLMTEAQLRSDIVVQKTLYNVATINQSVTPEEVKAYYDRHPELFGRPERWQLALIRVSTQAAADKAMADIQKGTPFATVAAQMTEDAAGRSKGGRLENARGELEWFSVNDTRLPDFIREAVKKLKKVGDVTPALQGTFGTPPKPTFYILRLLGKEEMNVQPLEQVRAQAERMALLDKVGGLKAVEAKLDEFRKTASIVIKLPGYEDLYKQ
jgi:parvulin-like peptidyl-prolyl isomerase